MAYKGIDISEWQGKIDWDKVKKAGIKFAIIRVGYGSDYTSQDDSYAKRNMDECERIGMPYGVYLFSYANTLAKAKSEAAHTLRLIKGRKLQMGVWYDIEDSNTSGSVSKSKLSEFINAYCSAIKAGGFDYVGVYANLNWLTNKIEDSIEDKYPIWVAQYNSTCNYKKDYDMWQYTSGGSVSGVSGRCDMNYYYKEIKDTEPSKPSGDKSVSELADEVIAGKWGNGDERKEKLEKAGYDYDAVQAEVNRKLNASSSKKSVEELAKEVLEGKWGNGTERRKKLENAGYDYEAVQEKVNELAGASNKKSISEIADEVIAGKWGNGSEREKKLEAAGYDYEAIQEKVNEKLGATTKKETSFEKGDKVKIKKGAKDYNGTTLASSVYSRTYDVIEVKGDRIVVGIGSAVTAAMKKSDIYKA